MVLTRAQRWREARRAPLGRNSDRKRRGEDGRDVRQKPGRLTMGTFNIMDGRGNRLELACKQLRRHGIDFGVLTETKVNGFHTHSAYGYDIFATKCSNSHQGGVAFIVRNEADWHVESVRRHGSNVIQCTLVHDDRRTNVLGVYIPPSEETMETMATMDKAMKNEKWDESIILGDLNVRFDTQGDSRSREIVNALKTYDLVDLSQCFRTRSKKPYVWTWRRFQKGEAVQSICDYILFGRRLRWKNFRVDDVQFDTDHRLIKGDLTLTRSWRYRAYLNLRKKPPLEIIPTDQSDGEPQGVNRQLQEIMDKVPKLTQPEREERNWISDETFGLLKRKCRALRANDSAGVHHYGRLLRRHIRRDRRRRIHNVAVCIEAKLDSGDIIGAYGILRHWYRKFTGKALKPSPIDISKTKETYDKLFTAEEFSQELPYDFQYDGPLVDDSVPEEDEIVTALMKMRNRKAPGLSKISVDQMKIWYRRAFPEEEEKEGDP